MTGRGSRPISCRIFLSLFVRAMRRACAPTKGLGLGLAIVRNLLELHGGSVQAMNREDRPGAIFKFVLPLNVSGSKPASSQQAPRFLQRRA